MNKPFKSVDEVKKHLDSISDGPAGKNTQPAGSVWHPQRKYDTTCVKPTGRTPEEEEHCRKVQKKQLEQYPASAKAPTKGKVLWFNKAKNYGEAKSEDGETVFILGDSYTGKKPLVPDMEIFMEVKKGELFGKQGLYSHKTTAKVDPKSPADREQYKIALDTVKNPNKALLGGPSVDEARETLKKKFKFSEDEIKKLEASLASLKLGETKIIASDLNPDHWIQTIKKIKDLAKNEEDWRALERIITRLHGIVQSILIGPHKDHPEVKKIADAKNEAVKEVEKKKKIAHDLYVKNFDQKHGTSYKGK